MDDITHPPSFPGTTPSEKMKGRLPGQSNQSRSPILGAIRQEPHPQNYSSITPGNSNTSERNQEAVVENPQHEDETDEGEESHDEAHGWFGSRMWAAFRHWERNHLELILENKQSVARDHLGAANIVNELIIANERTYLAWLRTSLSFASVGVAVTQLFRLSTTIQPGVQPAGFAALRRLGRPLGATFIGIAVVVLALGVHRFELRVR